MTATSSSSRHTILANIERYVINDHTHTAKREALVEREAMTVLALQKYAREFDLTTLVHTNTSAAFYGGGATNDTGYVHHRIYIHNIFGQPPRPENIDLLAHQLQVPMLDQNQINRLVGQIATGNGPQSGNINQLAGMLAPTVLMQGCDANLRIFGATVTELKKPEHAQHLLQHLNVWMRTLLDEQDIANAEYVMDSTMPALVKTIGVEFQPVSSPRFGPR